MASSEHRRPKSANPNRRLRTATHKVTDPRVRPGDPPPSTSERDEEFSHFNAAESVWNADNSLDDIIDEPSAARPSAVNKQRQTPSPTSAASTTYDSLMTFECIQKASALRVLAKTLDRQRDVLQQASGSTAGESADSRKTTTPPRKLRPLGREYSGPF
jgi:hypothetical protein